MDAGLEAPSGEGAADRSRVIGGVPVAIEMGLGSGNCPAATRADRAASALSDLASIDGASLTAFWSAVSKVSAPAIAGILTDASASHASARGPRRRKGVRISSCPDLEFTSRRSWRMGATGRVTGTRADLKSDQGRRGFWLGGGGAAPQRSGKADLLITVGSWRRNESHRCFGKHHRPARRHVAGCHRCHVHRTRRSGKRLSRLLCGKPDHDADQQQEEGQTLRMHFLLGASSPVNRTTLVRGSINLVTRCN